MTDGVDIGINDMNVDASNQTDQSNQSEQENNANEPQCEVDYWLANITYPQNSFNDFENWVVKAIKIKAPEFAEELNEINEELVEKYRFLIQEAVNETNYDLFVIGKRKCQQEYTPPENIEIDNVLPFYLADITKRFCMFKCCHIPIYDAKELQLALAFYVANALTLANNAELMPVGGIVEELTAGSVKINPRTAKTDMLNTSYYSAEYDKIVKRRKIINRQILVTRPIQPCCRNFDLCRLRHRFLIK